MTKDNGYTFFPSEAESAMLRTAPPNQLREIMQHQPDMTGRFMHELLRQGRRDELYAALAMCDELPVMLNTVLNDVAYSAGVMCGQYDVPRDEGKEFVDTAVEVLVRAANSIPLEVPLNEKATQVVGDVAGTLMSHADTMIGRFKS